MFTTCLEKQDQIKELFSSCHSKEDTYEKIIELGKKSVPLDSEDKTPENRVPGCQSIMYLKSTLKEGKVYFEAESEALISSGLAVLLTRVYSGETPETVLKCPPDYLESLNINASLSPSRANGLASIYLKMKQDALKCLVS